MGVVEQFSWEIQIIAAPITKWEQHFKALNIFAEPCCRTNRTVLLKLGSHNLPVWVKIYLTFKGQRKGESISMIPKIMPLQELGAILQVRQNQKLNVLFRWLQHSFFSRLRDLCKCSCGLPKAPNIPQESGSNSGKWYNCPPLSHRDVMWRSHYCNSPASAKT